jgi:hypothetical protein
VAMVLRFIALDESLNTAPVSGGAVLARVPRQLSRAVMAAIQ